MILKALIEIFQNQVSLLDLEQAVRNAVDSQSFYFHCCTEVVYIHFVTLVGLIDVSYYDRWD